jgi:NADPH:quinone reductase-like Zn-dependent oxidoreductase
LNRRTLNSNLWLIHPSLPARAARVSGRSLNVRAAIVDQPNAPFRIAEIETPKPSAGQVLVRFLASGVNPLDTKIRAGVAEHARQPLPAVLGMDLSGVVESVGSDITAFHTGDEVFGFAGGVGGLQGTLAEFAAVDARLIAKKPASLTMEQAAALPLSVITAWEGLVDRARVHTGQTVLIHAGAGGVGHVAVQIAAAFGATVFATVSASKAHIVRQFGAQPIDYQSQSVEEYVREFTSGAGFDIVYDTVGGAPLDASFTAVKRYTGHALSCLGWGTHSLAPLSFRGATYSGVFTLYPLLSGEGREHHGEILEQAARLAEAGRLVPLLHPEKFTLDSVEAAHNLVAAGKAQGKAVVTI